MASARCLPWRHRTIRVRPEPDCCRADPPDYGHSSTRTEPLGASQSMNSGQPGCSGQYNSAIPRLVHSGTVNTAFPPRHATVGSSGRSRLPIDLVTRYTLPIAMPRYASRSVRRYARAVRCNISDVNRPPGRFWMVATHGLACRVFGVHKLLARGPRACEVAAVGSGEVSPAKSGPQ